MNISLAKDVKKIVYDLALPEGRMVGTKGHERAQAYLVRQMEKLGLEFYSGNSFEIPYTSDSVSFCNIVGVVPGMNPRKKPMLIGAHYDSVIAAPCADDNAAAVAIALRTAELLKKKKPERDTIIAIFDAEEPPYFCSPSMGSIRFYEDQMNQRGVYAAIIMDLVGHDVQIPVEMLLDRLPGLRDRFPFSKKTEIPIPHIRNLVFITGAESHSGLAKVCDRIPRSIRLPIIHTLNRYVGDMSDHGIFRENGVPYLFLSCGRWQHYHQESDTPDMLNYSKIARITLLVEALIRHLADAKLVSSRSTETNTAALEIDSLKRTMGPLLSVLLRYFGIERLQSREDLDKLADGLLGLGL